MTRTDAIVPEYMLYFSCIGSECEDSCCSGWNIPIDKKTYQKYEHLTDPEYKEKIIKNIKLDHTAFPEGNYAKIKMNSEDGRCPFLTEKKLCSIHATLGESYLSPTCATYPKVANRVDSLLEVSAEVSCPEAARVALLNPNGIRFVKSEEFTFPYSLYKEWEPGSSSLQLEHYFYELRVFSIEILQNRMLAFPQRLVQLGFFFSKLQGLIERGQAGSIPAFVESFRNTLNPQEAYENYERIPIYPNVQLEILIQLLNIRMNMGIVNKQYLSCLNQFTSGIQYSEKGITEDVIYRYQDAYHLYYEPFMSQHQYIMENYAVNYVYKKLFPFSSSETPFDDYIMLVVHYALLKMQLIGIAMHHRGLTEELVIQLIYSYARTNEHAASFLEQVLAILKERGQNSLAHMALLIKN